MDQFIEEINEELKQENIANFFKKYGRYIVSIVLLVVVGVGATKGWHHMRDQQYQKDSFAFTKITRLAADQRDKAIASANFLIDDATSIGYRTLTLFKKAELLQAKDTVEGSKAYQAIIDDNSIETLYRNLARLLKAYLTYNTSAPNVLRDLVNPLLLTTNPWYPSAMELNGLTYIAEDNKDKAAEIFVTLSQHKDLPKALGARVDNYMALLK
jgi:hypothetical protein